MRQKRIFLDDDCFPDRDSDYSDYDVGLDDLAGTLDFDVASLAGTLDFDVSNLGRNLDLDFA